MLTKIRTALGSLDRVKRVVKVLGMVNSAEGSVTRHSWSTDFPISWWKSSVRLANMRALPLYGGTSRQLAD
jgi:hypothetical protein